MKNKKKILDIDPLETKDWIESMNALIQEKGNDRGHYIIQKLIERQSCLGGANPGRARTSTTNPYSICLENLAFIEAPWGEPGEPSHYPYVKMALHLAHEYFHPYC